MSIGFIIPLIHREKGKKARGYGKPYEELFEEAIKRVRDKIGEDPIKITLMSVSHRSKIGAL